MSTISAHTIYLRLIGQHDGFHQNVASLMGALARCVSPILIVDSFSSGFLDVFWVPMSPLYGLGLLLVLACKDSLEPHEWYKHKQASIHAFKNRMNALVNELKPRGGLSPGGAIDISKLQS